MPGSKMFRESPEFYRPVDFVDIRKAKDVTPENGVRLYSTQRAVSWRLQVRGLLTLATGRESKDFVSAFCAGCMVGLPTGTGTHTLPARMLARCTLRARGAEGNRGCA